MKKLSLALVVLIVLGVSQVAVGAAGDIIITEYMADPQDVGDDDGEYFEIYNTTSFAIDLSNWVIRDDGSDSHTLPTGLTIGGYSFFVLGRASNAYITPDHVYSNFLLSNSGDEIVVEDDSGTEICRVNYTDGDQFEEGGFAKSCELNDVTNHTNGVTLENNYVASSTLLGTNDMGSPGAAGNTATGGTATTTVQFASSSATVGEGDGTYNLIVSISNPDGSNATNADVVLTSGDAADIDNYTTQSVTFPAGSSDDQTVILTITDDGDDEGNETLTVELQNVTGGNSASAGSPSSFDLTITDNDGTTITNPSSGQLIITEVDTEYSRGVFVELYNNTTSTIDLTGVTLVHYNGGTPANVTINLSGTLAAGAYFIIARNQTNFENTYGFSADLYESNMFLNDGNEWLILDNGARATIDQFGDNGVTWTADHVFERTSYPNGGGDITNDWSDKGNVLGTPGTTNDTPLPVELGDFQAEVEKDGIRLLWTTESEIHNKGFYVYRSTDDKTYSKISGLIPGNGTTSETSTYSFMDKNVKYGQVYYYKISDVEEITLKETYHGPLAVIAGKGQTNPESPELPRSFELSQNMPNPFNPTTTITYDLPTKTYVSLKIYDANGRLVKTLMDRDLDAGYYSVNWNGTDNTGKTVNSGVYIYRLETDKEVESKSMILMK